MFCIFPIFTEERENLKFHFELGKQLQKQVETLYRSEDLSSTHIVE